MTSTNRQKTLLTAKPCVMALGFFDGVHLGHQQVLKEAKRVAEEQELPFVIMSFFPHPKEVLSNGKRIFPYLMPINDKRRIFEDLGADCFYLIQFDREFAGLSPREFVQTYLLHLGAKQVVAGFDFSYGYQGKGNLNTIKNDSDGKIEGINVDKIEWEGEKISSTTIRNMVLSGEMEKIPPYLGSDYQTEGRVMFRNNNTEIRLLRHYLLPAQGFYEVTLNHHQELLTQIASVYDGTITLFSSQGQGSPLNEWQTIRLSWKKRLSQRCEELRHVFLSSALVKS